MLSTREKAEQQIQELLLQIGEIVEVKITLPSCDVSPSMEK